MSTKGFSTFIIIFQQQFTQGARIFNRFTIFSCFFSVSFLNFIEVKQSIFYVKQSKSKTYEHTCKNLVIFDFSIFDFINKRNRLPVDNKASDMKS